MEYATTITVDGEEIDVIFEFSILPGSPGDYWTPGEDPSVEVTGIYFEEDGADIPDAYIFGEYEWALKEDALCYEILQWAEELAADRAAEDRYERRMGW